MGGEADEIARRQRAAAVLISADNKVRHQGVHVCLKTRQFGSPHRKILDRPLAISSLTISHRRNFGIGLIRCSSAALMWKFWSRMYFRETGRRCPIFACGLERKLASMCCHGYLDAVLMFYWNSYAFKIRNTIWILLRCIITKQAKKTNFWNDWRCGTCGQTSFTVPTPPVHTAHHTLTLDNTAKDRLGRCVRRYGVAIN